MSWWTDFLKRGFKFTFHRDWPGEKGEGQVETEPDLSDKKTEHEIEDSLKKGD